MGLPYPGPWFSLGKFFLLPRELNNNKKYSREDRLAVVVVVDDRVTNRNIICRLARTLGTDVKAMGFGDPRAALAFIKERPPELVITDFSMPEMDGAEFVLRCRSIADRDMPIIVVTAYEDRDFRYRALEAGATDFILSPIDHREFRTRAINLLTLSRQQRLVRQKAQALEGELADALRQQADNWRASEERLRRIIDTVPALITMSDGEGRCLLANRYRLALTGGSEDENDENNDEGRTLEELFGKDYALRHRPLDRHVQETGSPLPSFEEELRDPWGRTRVLLTTKTPIPANGGIEPVLTVSVDITDRKEYERRLFYQANYDDTTGLPNRLLSMDRLSQAIARAERHGRKVAALYVDLDEFKKVNDTAGHAVGDALLLRAADRIAGCIRSSDTLGRLGGDEFLILLPDLENESQPELVVNKILEALRPPYVIGGSEFYLGASIGVTVYPEDGTVPEELLRNADAAMYRAKAAGRNTYCFFSPKISHDSRKRVEMERLLRHALEKRELDLAYQPIARVADGALVGVEALLRWRNGELGMVMPDQFIPLAEETGLIVEIGEWVLNTACRQAVRWQEQTGRPVRVSVNVSYRQFVGQDFAAVVEKALAASGLSPDMLELEITERLLMHDVGHALDVLSRLRRMGVRLAIDDFGTGYASIMYLKRFPFTTVKIDKLFIADVVESGDSASLVRAIISMAHDLKLEVVGEGVETARQLDFLRHRRCDLFQGYFLSRPVEAGAIAELGLLAPAAQPT